MKKQKKFLAVLSAAAVSTMIAAAVSTTAFAKTTDVIAKIDGQEVKINFEELTTAYENKAAGLDSELFNKYNEREGLTALLDDKNGFVDYKAVQEAAEDAVALGEKFVLNDFTENTEKKLADFKHEAEWKDGKVVPVEEGLKVESVSAINSTQAEVKFNMAVKEATVLPRNFKVTDKDGNPLFVSKAELSEDKKVVTLSFFNKFADKAIYNVEVSNVIDADGNTIEKATAQFGYESAKVAKVEFTATSVQKSKDLREIIKITDELGRDVTKEQKDNLEFTSSNTNVVTDKGVATDLSSAGDVNTAVVTVKVKDTTISAKAVIKVSDGVETNYVGFAIDKSDDLPETTKAFKEAKEIRTYTTMSGEDSLALYFNDQYGESMSKVTATKITNLTPNVVILNANGTITPVSAGTGYVKVKVGEVEQTLTINVRNVGKVAEFTVEKDAVELVTKGAAAELKLNFVDQYGTKMNYADAKKDATIEVKNSDTKGEIATASETAGKLTISPKGEGTATVTITYKGKDAADKDIELKQTVNVTVAKAGEFTDYVAEIDKTNLDVYAEANDDKDANVATIKVYPLDSNGRKLAAKDADEIVLLDKDGKEIENDKKVIEITDNNTITAKGAGKATVAVKVGTYVVDTFTFEVVNTTPGVPHTVMFTSTGVQNVAVDANVFTELEKILSVKDINGEKLSIGTEDEDEVKAVEFDILVGNATNATVNTTLGDITVADVSKPASVDIVVRNIKLYGDTEKANLLKEVKDLSEVVKITFDVEAAQLEVAKTAYNEAVTAAQEVNVDVEEHKVADVEKATKAELEEATTAINDAVKEAKIYVKSVEASNDIGKDKLVIVLSDTPKKDPTAMSVKVTRKIDGNNDTDFNWNGGSSSWDADTKTLTITGIEPVASTDVEQKVVYSVSYGEHAAKDANELTVS